MKTYASTLDGWVAGRRVRIGDEITLTATAALHEPVSQVNAVTADVATDAPDASTEGLKASAKARVKVPQKGPDQT